MIDNPSTISVVAAPADAITRPADRSNGALTESGLAGSLLRRGGARERKALTPTPTNVASTTKRKSRWLCLADSGERGWAGSRLRRVRARKRTAITPPHTIVASTTKRKSSCLSWSDSGECGSSADCHPVQLARTRLAATAAVDRGRSLIPSQRRLDALKGSKNKRI